MGLYNNRIVVKVGTSTLTNDAGKKQMYFASKQQRGKNI